MPETLDSIKNVRLYQSRKGYRFTIDSVLLAYFVNKLKPRTIADVGAGNGIVGILLAKRFVPATVTLMEVQKGLHELCKRNIELNRLKSRVTSLQCDLRRIKESRADLAHVFDIVVANPPFRVPGTGKISPHDEKAIARHELMMDLPGLVSAVDFLLKPRGSVYLIYHPERLAGLFTLLRDGSIEPKRARFIHPHRHAGAKMVLVEGVKAAREAMKIEKPLFIYNRRHEYTDELMKILQ